MTFNLSEIIFFAYLGLSGIFMPIFFVNLFREQISSTCIGIPIMNVGYTETSPLIHGFEIRIIDAMTPRSPTDIIADDEGFITIDTEWTAF